MKPLDEERVVAYQHPVRSRDISNILVWRVADRTGVDATMMGDRASLVSGDLSGILGVDIVREVDPGAGLPPRRHGHSTYGRSAQIAGRASPSAALAMSVKSMSVVSSALSYGEMQLADVTNRMFLATAANDDRQPFRLTAPCEFCPRTKKLRNGSQP